MLKKLYAGIASLFLFTGSLFSQNEPFSMRVVNPGYQLNSAWELTWGPDDSLWITENKAYKVSRINPLNGGITQLIDLSANKNFAADLVKWPQGGLMGMALHPTLYKEWPNASRPWVYLAYVYKNAGCFTGKSGQDSGCFFKTKIVRYNYNRSTHSLSNEQVIIQTLNGSTDHNSGRLTIGEISGIPYLFYTIGDMGTGQFTNVLRKNRAQSRDSLEGKILRFNLEPDVNGSWIPNDNPFKNANSAVTAVWSWGHRNAQGIVFGSNGILYSSEQQDKSDDEINIIEKGGNYGWPLVSGYCDGNYDGLTLANLPVISEKADSVLYNLKSPFYTLYTIPNPGSLGTDNSKWPTVACSGIEVYEKGIIPGWNRSLLIPSLKAGLIQRLKLDPTGTRVTDSSSIPAMRNKGRYRDLCVSSDGLKIYVACDMSGANPGRILEFTYTGKISTLSINDSVQRYPRSTNVEIFPNPSSRILNVKIGKSASKPLHYIMFDITGKPLIYGKSNNDYFSVNVEALSPGMYILKLFNAYHIPLSTRKIMIK